MPAAVAFFQEDWLMDDHTITGIGRLMSSVNDNIKTLDARTTKSFDDLTDKIERLSNGLSLLLDPAFGAVVTLDRRVGALEKVAGNGAMGKLSDRIDNIVTDVGEMGKTVDRLKDLKIKGGAVLATLLVLAGLLGASAAEPISRIYHTIFGE
jgi:hypothetical protein